MPGRMPGIYLRHVSREAAVQTLVVAAVLLAVLAVYQFSFVLGRAADGQIEGGTVLPLALLTLRTNLGVILPFAVLLGVVLALGRLHHDHEITVAEASGVGPLVLYAAAAMVVLPGTLLAGWVSFIDGPAAARDAVELRLAALRTSVTRGLTAGGFRSVGEGTTLHFASRDVDGSLRGVFLQRELPPEAGGATRIQVVLAERAIHHIDEASTAIEVELIDGQTHEGTPGGLDWRVLDFDRQRMRLPAPQARLPGPPRMDQVDNRALLAADDPRHRAELHWRIGWVAAVLVLGFIAVPLGRLAPRQGRHARVPAAVLLFAAHAGLLISGKTLLERGQTPMWLGLWWVPMAVVVLAVALTALPRLTARLRRRGAKHRLQPRREAGPTS